MTGGFRQLLGLALLGVGLALPAAQQDRHQSEQDLKAVNENIARVQQQLTRDAMDRDRANRDLRQAERSEASARGSLRDLGTRRAAHAATRQKLQDQRAGLQDEREQDRQDLARQLRAAYFMGQDEPLKLLLNQGNPGEFSRTLTYYGYLGRRRAAQIAKLDEDVAQIDDLTTRIDAEDRELASLEKQQQDRVGELRDATQQRGQILAALEKQSRSRSAQLADLQKQRQQLEDLLKKLAKEAEAVPYDSKAPFAKARGTLAWPVAGHITVDFGDALAGGGHSSGIEIEAERGAEVHAVRDGRVVLADWWPGMGLLIIVDHGDGYLSIYGHNEQLYRQKDATVRAGETIATAGDSGGRKTPALYFEIRRDSKPVNPHDWFRSREPPKQ